MSDLQSAFDALDGEQRAAVRHDGNTVVLAGPGSGKTATLVVKVADLVTRTIPPPSGVACLTFNNDTVEEFRARLHGFGIRGGPRVFLGTVHSFCLNCVVRPYAGLAEGRAYRRIAVASQQVAEATVKEIVVRHMPGEYQAGIPPMVTRYRRARACNEDLSGFDDRLPAAVTAYEAELSANGLVDFETMVLRALDLIRNHAWIRDLLAARFPWLVVDEYQDLGGPLHRIVTELLNHGGTTVFAVGDPDQTVYDFTGADPRYLRELTERTDFTTFRLPFNYRSGGDLILAGEAALAPEEARGYQPRPGRDDRGRVEFRAACDSLESHAEHTVSAVRECIENGVPPHEVAILYRSRREVLPEVRRALDAAGIAYSAERDKPFPPSPLSRWLQAAAGWAVHASAERESSFEDLVHFFEALLAAAGEVELPGRSLAARTELHELLLRTEPSTPLHAWLIEIEERLELSELLTKAQDRSADDAEVFRNLLALSAEGAELEGSTVLDFARDGRVTDQVVLTTLHSSKGRQFDVVILPGLIEGLMPRWRWNRSRRAYDAPTPKELAEARRLFYVGFTRARHVVYLIYSNRYRNRYSYVNGQGPSRLVRDIAARLLQNATA